jgi:hypothetical protein
MKRIIYIGVDDTDIPGSPGTGRIAKTIGDLLAGRGLGSLRGVIRHQLLVSESIPYTSHNSAKCIEFESDRTLEEIAGICAEYFRDNYLEGSDPGICICQKDLVSERVIRYGNRATTEIIDKEEARQLAAEENIILEEHGGNGDGIIGALAAVGLSAGGNDGRYVQMKGIKEIKGLITVEALLNDTDIVSVIDEKGRLLNGSEVIDSLGWVRPSLVGGQPKLRVKPADRPGNERLWEPVLRSHKAQKGAKI